MFNIQVKTADAFSKLDSISMGIDENVQYSLNYWASRALTVARNLNPVLTGNMMKSSVIISKNDIGLSSFDTGSFVEGAIKKSDDIRLSAEYGVDVSQARAEVGGDINPNGIMFYSAYYAPFQESKHHFFDTAETLFTNNIANVAAANLANYLRG